MEAIDRIEARAAITDLVHSYALAVRRGDPAAAIAALFTSDGVFEVCACDPLVPGSDKVLSRNEGRDTVSAYIVRAGRKVRMLPMIHNLIVMLDSAETATATSLMVARPWPSGPEMIGNYADSLRIEDGAWRFSARRYTIFRDLSGVGSNPMTPNRHR